MKLLLIIFLSVFSWLLSKRVHIWSEFVNKQGVRITVIIQGEPKKLTQEEKVFLGDVSKEMLTLQYAQPQFKPNQDRN